MGPLDTRTQSDTEHLAVRICSSGLCGIDVSAYEFVDHDGLFLEPQNANETPPTWLRK